MLVVTGSKLEFFLFEGRGVLDSYDLPICQMADKLFLFHIQ